MHWRTTLGLSFFPFARRATVTFQPYYLRSNPTTVFSNAASLPASPLASQHYTIVITCCLRSGRVCIENSERAIEDTHSYEEMKEYIYSNLNNQVYIKISPFQGKKGHLTGI